MPELVIIFKISKRCERTCKISILREGATSKGQVFFSGGGAGISDEILHNIFYWENSMYPTLMWVRIKVWYGIKFNQYLWISLRENILIFYFQLAEKLFSNLKYSFFMSLNPIPKILLFKGGWEGRGHKKNFKLREELLLLKRGAASKGVEGFYKGAGISIKCPEIFRTSDKNQQNCISNIVKLTYKLANISCFSPNWHDAVEHQKTILVPLLLRLP